MCIFIPVYYFIIPIHINILLYKLYVYNINDFIIYMYMYIIHIYAFNLRVNFTVLEF